MRERRFDSARTLLEQALDESPGFADVHCLLGEVRLETGDEAMAEHSFREALHRNPEYVDALVGLGLLCRRKGADDEARECFRRVLDLDPAHPVALSQLED